MPATLCGGPERPGEAASTVPLRANPPFHIVDVEQVVAQEPLLQGECAVVVKDGTRRRESLSGLIRTSNRAPRVPPFPYEQDEAGT